jgi:colanic acid/amylovoran biosynthesis glycosyltransferase
MTQLPGEISLTQVPGKVPRGRLPGKIPPARMPGKIPQARMPEEVQPLGRRLRRAARHARRAVVRWIYERSIRRWEWWPLPLASALSAAGATRTRIGYNLWHFPVLSQTFVRREVAALRRCGLSVTVFAQGAEDLELFSEEEQALLEWTEYVPPVDPALLRRDKKMFFRRRPLAYLQLYMFVLSHSYDARKSLERDGDVWDEIVYLAGRLRENAIQHVHAPWADRHGFNALVAARLLDLPYSVQTRAHELHDPSYQGPLSSMFRNAEFIITNTLYNRQYIRWHLDHGRAPSIHTIYNGLDLSRFVPERRARRREAPLRILCVARLIEQKGLVYLLEACHLLRRRGLPFTCDVLGGPEEPRYTSYLQRLMDLHRRLGLEGEVRFHGMLPFAHVLEACRAADIFVLPCVISRDGRRDITPNALLEAMAMKLPVVSTRITGIPEMVEDGVSGLLVPPGRLAELADAIERLMRDPELRERLGEGARKRIEERFDVEKNVRSYLRLFSGAVAPAVPAPSGVQSAPGLSALAPGEEAAANR